MLLHVRNIAYAINGTPILRDISFSVAAGERWAVIGKNGSGKSTLIKCAAGLLPADKGAILLNEKPLAAYTAKQRGTMIAYVPQINDTSLPFSVYDFVMMGRFPYYGFMAKATSEDKKIVEDSLELTELTAYADRRMNSLSGGELQRVYLAGAVAQRAPLLLLDEPTTFLDPNHRQGIQKALDRIHDALGNASITVTHDIATIFSNFSHILALKNGSVVFSGACASIADGHADFLSSIFDVAFESFVSSKGIMLLASIADAYDPKNHFN